MPDPTEELMAGLDAARPLPAELRARLEHALVESGEAEHRPLHPDLTERLQDALADPVAGVMDGVDGPRPLDPELRRRLEGVLQPGSRRPRLLLAAAAALAVLAGVGLALGLSGSNTASPQRALSHVAGGASSPSAGVSAGAGTSAGTPSNAGVGGLAPSAAAPQAQGLNGTAGLATVPPTISSVTPNSGPTTGGTWVTITGSGLSGVRSVTFGGAPAQFMIESATSLRALAPAHIAGTVDVQVANSSGTSPASPQDRYTFR